MTEARATSSHPSMGELLRQLDGELGRAEAGKLSKHLERCTACRGRMAELREDSLAAGQYLRSLPSWTGEGERAQGRVLAEIRVAERRRSLAPWRRGWAAAAAIAALLVVTMAVDPLRAWMLARLASVGSGAEEASGPVVAIPTTVVGGVGSVVAFHPSGPRFELLVEHPQVRGELLLQIRRIDRATAQVTNAGDETMLVLPSGLHIENAPSSSASYRVTLPTSVSEIQVRVGERLRVLSISRTSEAWSESIPLQPGERE